MTKPKAQRVRVGQGSPGDALTLAYLPLGVLIAILLASLFSFAFQLGFAPPLISLGLLAVLIVAVGFLTRQVSVSAAAGTRLNNNAVATNHRRDRLRIVLQYADLGTGRIVFGQINDLRK